jgi:hypothetical protein
VFGDWLPPHPVTKQSLRQPATAAAAISGIPTLRVISHSYVATPFRGPPTKSGWDQSHGALRTQRATQRNVAVDPDMSY